jgi:luciferase family oxidoreductase group 1
VPIASPVPLSVLDLAPVAEGSRPADALANSLDLARLAEGLGYHRLWVAEHHNMPGIASSAPAVLIAHLAAGTSTLRLGSGGVMLPNHAPLVIAEQFGTLEALHPGRIDLGLGRAPGTDGYTAAALRHRQDGGGHDDFPDQLIELMAYFDGRVEHITATPGEGDRPDVWLLGSSGYSAELAGYLGLPFAFARHFSARNTLPALALYRERFRPSARLAQPYAMVCTAIVCADTTADAERIVASSRLSILNLRRGRPGRMPGPDEALAHVYSPQEQAVVDEHMAGYLIGDPEVVRAGIDELLAATAADELMVSTSAFDHADRRRSFELVAGLYA